MKTLFVLISLLAATGNTLAVDYYVSATGANTNDGKSATTPFLTIQKVADLTVAGDTVFIMNGTYASTSGTLLNVTRLGTAAGYITYKALKGYAPKLKASGNVWNAVSINGSYVVLEGIELEGNNANLTYDGALAAYQAQVAGGAASATETITIQMARNPPMATRIGVFNSTGSPVKKQAVSSATTLVSIQELPAGLNVVVVYQNELPASVHKFIKR